ncbi:MAG TPA: hypothetical protein VN893_03855 [Bryobacteraceae bacterium]|nr:hypothetical protein [Bryobacteraceae bacterium]
MKTSEQIAERIHELREQLKRNERERKSWCEEKGIGHTTLGITHRRRCEGQIEALEWVLTLESGTQI